MSAMRTARLHRPAPIETHPLVLENASVPVARDGQMLVRVSACGICRTDLHDAAPLLCAGIIICPVAMLSRMEARTAIAGVLARFPRLRLAGEPRWRRTIILRGLEHLPVRVD